MPLSPPFFIERRM